MLPTNQVQEYEDLANVPAVQVVPKYNRKAYVATDEEPDEDDGDDGDDDEYKESDEQDEGNDEQDEDNLGGEHHRRDEEYLQQDEEHQQDEESDEDGDTERSRPGPIPEAAKDAAFIAHATYQRHMQEIANEYNKPVKKLFQLVGHGVSASRFQINGWNAFQAWYGVNGKEKKPEESMYTILC